MDLNQINKKLDPNFSVRWAEMPNKPKMYLLYLEDPEGNVTSFESGSEASVIGAVKDYITENQLWYNPD